MWPKIKAKPIKSSEARGLKQLEEDLELEVPLFSDSYTDNETEIFFDDETDA